MIPFIKEVLQGAIILCSARNSIFFRLFIMYFLKEILVICVFVYYNNIGRYIGITDLP